MFTKNFIGAIFMRENYPLGKVFLVGNFPGGGGNFPGGIFPGDIFPGGIFPRTLKNHDNNNTMNFKT